VTIGVDIPQVGDSPSVYVEKIKTSLEAIDAHDHTNDPVTRLHADAVDGVTVEVSSNVARVKANSITNAYLDPAFGGLAGTGTVVEYGANIGSGSPPSGWLRCNGQLVSTSTYSALFAIIGYSCGGSGATFRVPDLRGVVPRGFDNARGLDNDKTTRSNRYTGGNTGNNLGTYQDMDFPSHTHQTNNDQEYRYLFANAITFSRAGGPGGVVRALITQPHSSLSSGTYNAPKNVYVEFIIKT
jgi:microcystin-dependent protein